MGLSESPDSGSMPDQALVDEIGLSPRHPTQHYTQEEIDLGLTVLAMHDGKAQRASEALALSGKNYPRTTLNTWKLYSYPERYLEIAREKAPLLEQKVTRQAWENSHRAAEVVAQAIDKAEQQLADPKTDAATVAYKLSLTHGIQQDKALAIEGRPSQITAHVDAEDLLEKLNRMIPGLVIDGSAEDVS